MTRFKHHPRENVPASHTPKKANTRKPVYDRQERILRGLPKLEEDIHEEVIEECKYIKYKNSTVGKYLHHSPNGGFRNKAEAARFKRMGTQPGFPDLFLFIANEVFKGLFIELKSGTNKVTLIQEDMHRRLEEEGYRVVVCYSRQAVINAIKNYLNIKIS